MLIFALIFPAITTALLALIMRKAGFRALGYLVAAAPLFGAALPHTLFGLGQSGLIDPMNGIFALVPLVFVLLSLAPLAFLAAVRWPALKGTR
jgi:hypothetical protein